MEGDGPKCWNPGTCSCPLGQVRAIEHQDSHQVLVQKNVHRKAFSWVVLSMKAECRRQAEGFNIINPEPELG